MRKPATLLEFAIAASVAVVPVLLVVLLVVAWWRPNDPGARPARDGDRGIRASAPGREGDDGRFLL